MTAARWECDPKPHNTSAVNRGPGSPWILTPVNWHFNSPSVKINALSSKYTRYCHLLVTGSPLSHKGPTPGISRSFSRSFFTNFQVFPGFYRWVVQRELSFSRFFQVEFCQQFPKWTCSKIKPGSQCKKSHFEVTLFSNFFTKSVNIFKIRIFTRVKLKK